MRDLKLIIVILFLLSIAIYQSGCNYITHRTLAIDNPYDSNKGDQDPNYNVSLDYNYQDFVAYFYIGNRVENFTAYFNTFYRSQEDFDDAYEEYRASLISLYNRRLDSLGVVPPISGSVKEKLDKAIERSSKIIQFHKNSKFIDDAVLIIGKSYYYEQEYYKAERTFNEFLSKFSSSVFADEAILFLGKTKLRLGKDEEGEKIFKNLVKNSTDNEVRSQAARDLGIIEYNKGKFEDAANYFKASIDFSQDKERKAEGQFILAKILSDYKPQLSSAEYNRVLEYTSDFDLTFYSRLNYAKGLIYNKDFSKAEEELESVRKKYRDEPGFTQLVDLEIGNSLYAQKNYEGATDKYYEVIVKYPNTPSASVAYYYLAKHYEEINNDYLNAYVNYKKAVEENPTSDFYKESLAKSGTFETYFSLQDEVRDSGKVDIPTANAELEKYRRKYNEEKGIESIENTSGTQPPSMENSGDQKGNTDDGSQKGDGKGKPGGSKSVFSGIRDDSLKEDSNSPVTGPLENRRDPNSSKKNDIDNTDKKTKDTLDPVVNDSIRAAEEEINKKEKEDKVFNAYYELAELFMYNINQNDSAEYYLKLLLTKFPESEKQTKILYTLGNFYKNTGRKLEADQTFEKIISTYPNTIYASESKKILGIKSSKDDVTLNPIDEIFTKAFNLFNQNKFTEAISTLREVEVKYPQDTLVAKCLYSIGWIYENMLVNKDSSLFYYNKLSEKFPQSEYTAKVTPMIEYIASIEAQAKLDSTGVNPSVNDSAKVGIDSANVGNEQAKNENNPDGKKEGSEEVKIDTAKSNDENRLSQEEIDKLLKESESEPPK